MTQPKNKKKVRKLSMRGFIVVADKVIVDAALTYEEVKERGRQHFISKGNIAFVPCTIIYKI